MASRRASIEKRIEELEQLLDEWESYQLVARDPGEVRRSQHEISRIKSYLSQYQNELAGSGSLVHEDKENPLIRPAIRRNNKKWIVSILTALIILLGGYFTYEHVTRDVPNYETYLAFLSEGDKLIEENKFTEAKAAYKRALAFNPQDSAAIQKIALLDEATQYVKQENFEKAKQLFQVIVNIPASSGLAITASTSGGNSPPSDTQEAGQMQIKIEWSGDKLTISISGGFPFNDPKRPYALDGINCKDCITWKKQGEGYLAEIKDSKVNVLSINVTDRKGNKLSSDVPPKSDSPTPTLGESPPVNTAMREEQFQALIESADKSFQAGKYAEAKKDYVSALAIKRNDAHATKRLSECEEKLRAVELAEAKKIALQTCSGGTFQMGFEDGLPEERPVHEVTISSFKIMPHEVTVEQYKRYCRFANVQMPPPPPYGWVDEYPMTNVTWEEADAYCKWIGGRLPTEAEWEYAARDGGGKSTYSGGNQINSLAVFAGNSSGRPAKVSSKRPNDFRLYDMTGNVSEWCADWYGKYSEAAKNNPKGPSSGKYKVVRGGAYNSTPNSTQDGDQLRVTYRNSKLPSTREPYLGFRVAR